MLNLRKILTKNNNIVKHKAIHQFGKIGVKVLGGVLPQQQASLPQHYNFDAHVFHSPFSSTHYGVMIPDLPEPFRYLSHAAVIGDVGAKITKSDKISAYPPLDTATFVHGTALSDPKKTYRIYSIKQHLKFQKQPFKIEYAEDSVLYQENDKYRLVSDLNDLQADLTLTPTEAITWFTYGPLYQHFSVLMQYEGQLTQQGHTIDVQGLCTLEHWKAVSTHVLPKFLSQRFAVPMDVFSYQVINLNDQEQLVLAFVGFLGEPAYTAVSYRHIDGTSIQYEDAVFKIITLNVDPQITPDGFSMEVPQSFQWIVHHENQKVLDITCVVDTPYCYGLAAGYVSAYHWSGEFRGQQAEGRGYLEYIDRP